MSREDEHKPGLVPSSPAALSRAGAASLVRRGVRDLLTKAEVDTWYQQGSGLSIKRGTKKPPNVSSGHSNSNRRTAVQTRCSVDSTDSAGASRRIIRRPPSGFALPLSKDLRRQKRI